MQQKAITDITGISSTMKTTRNSEEVKLTATVTTPRASLFDFSEGGVDTIQSQTLTKCCYLGVIIREHPRKDWILHEIIVRAAR